MSKVGLTAAALFCCLGFTSTLQARVTEDGARRGPLRLKGRFTKVELRRGGERRLYRVTFDLELVNEGDAPAILFPGAEGEDGWWLLTTRAARSPAALAKHDYVYFAALGLGRSLLTPRRVKLRKDLNTPRPPPGLTVTIEPGRSLAFRREVALEVYEYDIPAGDPALWVRLSFQMWPPHVEVGPKQEFGRRLQHRWRKYGLLQLEPITSEPIRVVLQSPVLEQRR
jgi:hypothetical protein